MTQLTIDIPEAVAWHLARLASEQNKSVEQVLSNNWSCYSGRYRPILRNNTSGSSGRAAFLLSGWRGTSHATRLSPRNV
jgi:hypothetical protein